MSFPSRKIGKILGDFLQVVFYSFGPLSGVCVLMFFLQYMQGFPASDILANDVLFDEKGAIVLTALLCSHLTNDKRLVIFLSHFSPFVSVQHA
jgi:hypothetical protein